MITIDFYLYDSTVKQNSSCQFLLFLCFFSMKMPSFPMAFLLFLISVKIIESVKEYSQLGTGAFHLRTEVRLIRPFSQFDTVRPENGLICRIA